MKIKVLGSGCIDCERTTLNVLKALQELDLQADIVQVREPKQILLYPITDTPAVVIDELIASEGRVPSTDEIRNWLEQTRSSLS